MPLLETLALLAAIGSGVSNMGSAAFNMFGQEEEERPVGGPFRGSQFTPKMGQDTMQRYAPQNRPPQSGVSPDIMAYLRKYIR